MKKQYSISQMDSKQEQYQLNVPRESIFSPVKPGADNIAKAVEDDENEDGGNTTSEYDNEEYDNEIDYNDEVDEGQSYQSQDDDKDEPTVVVVDKDVTAEEENLGKQDDTSFNRNSYIEKSLEEPKTQMNEFHLLTPKK